MSLHACSHLHALLCCWSGVFVVCAFACLYGFISDGCVSVLHVCMLLYLCVYVSVYLDVL